LQTNTILALLADMELSLALGINCEYLPSNIVNGMQVPLVDVRNVCMLGPRDKLGYDTANNVLYLKNEATAPMSASITLPAATMSRSIE